MGTYRKTNSFHRMSLTGLCTFCGETGANGFWTCARPAGGYVEVCERCVLHILPALMADSLDNLHRRTPDELAEHLKNVFLRALALRMHRVIKSPPVAHAGNPACPDCQGEGWINGDWCQNCVEVEDRTQWGGLRDVMLSDER